MIQKSELHVGKLWYGSSTSHHNIAKKHLRRLMVTYRVHRRVPMRNRHGGRRTANPVRSHDCSFIYSGVKGRNQHRQTVIRKEHHDTVRLCAAGKTTLQKQQHIAGHHIKS